MVPGDGALGAAVGAHHLTGLEDLLAAAQVVLDLLVRVLAELGLVILEREAPALTVVESPERTALERSAAFRAYQQTHEDGLTFLASSTQRAAA